MIFLKFITHQAFIMTFMELTYESADRFVKKHRNWIVIDVKEMF